MNKIFLLLIYSLVLGNTLHGMGDLGYTFWGSHVVRRMCYISGILRPGVSPHY